MDKADISMRSMYEFGDRLAAPSASEIDELVDRSQTLEQRIQSLNDSYETLKKREMELTEWRWVLREAGGFFDRVSFADAADGPIQRLTCTSGSWTDRRDPPLD